MLSLRNVFLNVCSTILRRQKSSHQNYFIQPRGLNFRRGPKTLRGRCHFPLQAEALKAEASIFGKYICSEEDLRCTIFGTFVVKFLACLPLLGFSNI